jgi:predicted TIM-barrel fold metal-dependent hydrolase
VPFILAHAGAQRFWRGLLFGRAIPNLFYDLSSHYVTRAKMRVLVRAVGPRRMLFGSDVPVMANSPGECLGRIDALGLAAADTSAIKGGTVATLLRGICH